jgi:hypothetical protein
VKEDNDNSLENINIVYVIINFFCMLVGVYSCDTTNYIYAKGNTK